MKLYLEIFITRNIQIIKKKTFVQLNLLLFVFYLHVLSIIRVT